MADDMPNSGPTSRPPKGAMAMLEYYLVTKAPFQIPEGGRKAIVQWGPWIELVLLVLSLPLLLLALGISAFFLPFAAVGSPGVAAGITLPWIALLIQLVLMAASLPGLFARKKQGWMLAFYAQVVSFVSSILYGNIVSAVLGIVIGFYVLFQIKKYYS